jgi:DNA polymerase III, delta subunit
MDFTNYITSLRSRESVTPIILDRDSALDLLSTYTGVEITDIASCQTGNFPDISLYGVVEDKKEFSITTVRECIIGLSIQPYSGKSIILLNDLDTASLEAQNALLKVLEDCPSYAALILIVRDPE